MASSGVRAETALKPELRRLLEKQQSLLPNIRSDGTNYQYVCAWERFEKWCEREDVRVDAYLCDAGIVALYLTAVLEEAKSPAPVKNALAAILFFRKLVCQEELTHELPIVMMRELNNRQFGERDVKHAKVITESLLRRLHAEFAGCINDRLDLYQDLVVILFGVDAYGRFSDIAHRLSVTDLIFSCSAVLECKFEKRKNDQYGKFAPLIVTRRGDKLSSVQHVEALLVVTGRKEGPLFRQVKENKKTKEVTFMPQPMSYAQMLARMRQRLQDVGLSKEEAAEYGTHSMRRSGNNIDASHDVPRKARKVQGQWGSERSMVPYEDKKAQAIMVHERQQHLEGVDDKGYANRVLAELAMEAEQVEL